MPAASSLIKVTIVEDHQKIRDGLTALIDGTDGFRAASSFGSMEDALAGIGQDLPDVALLDIGLPGMSGVEGVRVLKERYPNLLFLMLTVYDDDAASSTPFAPALAAIF
jgi:DNA-binding NarL/FixJ family response regulator